MNEENKAHELWLEAYKAAKDANKLWKKAYLEGQQAEINQDYDLMWDKAVEAARGMWNVVEAARKEQKASMDYKKEIDSTLENKEN